MRIQKYSPETGAGDLKLNVRAVAGSKVGTVLWLKDSLNPVARPLSLSLRIDVGGPRFVWVRWERQFAAVEADGSFHFDLDRGCFGTRCEMHLDGRLDETHVTILNVSWTTRFTGPGAGPVVKATLLKPVRLQLQTLPGVYAGGAHAFISCSHGISEYRGGCVRAERAPGDAPGEEATVRHDSITTTSDRPPAAGG